MKRFVILVALVLVVALGSYAIFAQQAANMVPGGAGGMMGDGTAGAMNGGMMGNMDCSGCGALMQTTVAATSDGGVVVAAAGKLIKYDAALKKVSEVDIDVDWNAAQQTQQTMQNCPMMPMMK